MELRTEIAALAIAIATFGCAARPAVAIQPAAPADASGDRFDSVAIDAGHGGDDEGARGPSGSREKDVVLDVAKRLERRLRERGLSVLMTRDRDVFVPLETRTMLANDATPDLFISIHANAAVSRSPRGIEVFFASLDASDERAREVAERENSAFGSEGAAPDSDDPLVAIIGDMIVADTMRESSEFARLAQHRLDELDGVTSRGVKQAPFVVLLGVQVPSVLVEIGFLSNPDEEKALRSASRREAIADALERAVVAWGARYDATRGASARHR